MIEVPQKYPGKRSDDQVIIFARKHWIKYAFLFLIGLLLAMAVPLIFIVFFYLRWYSMSVEALTIGISCYLMIILGLVLHTFVDYYLDMFIVTQDRIILVRQNGFFNQQHDEMNIDNIDEIGVDVKGLVRSVFDYGDIVLHSGSDEAVLTIHDIGNPNTISKKIMELHHAGNGGNIRMKS